MIQTDDIVIDPNSALVRSLNLLYNPNFYDETDTTDGAFIDVNDSPVDLMGRPSHISHLSMNLDANSIPEAAMRLREFSVWWGEETSCSIVIDLEVEIGGITKTCTFEELFRWMGFEE